MTLILLTLLICYTFLFLYSLKIRDNSIVDVFWGFGFMIIAVISFFQSDQGLPQYMLTGLVLLWGIRLTSHIGFRKLREGKEDPRYAKWREEWGSGWYFRIRSFLQVYILQMVLMFAVALPILGVNLSPLSFSAGESLSGKEFLGADPSFLRMTNSWIFLGIASLIALFGLIFETISDLQLKAFLKIKKPWQIFMTGLYRYSRHPNYFGESMFWLGISIISLPMSIFGIIGWITITCLLLFVSWVPLQEARYAGKPEWEEYKARTSVFVPWFVKGK
jgi:steroid 5-alpha reductase family enzyme